MLSLAFDWVGGYFAAKKIKNFWLLLISAIGIGVSSSILGNLIIHFFTVSSPDETFVGIVVGFVWHPLISMISVLIYRKRFVAQNQIEPSEEERERRRQKTIEVQNKMQEEKLHNHQSISGKKFRIVASTGRDPASLS